MGISHPLSDEYDALRGAVLSPERTPPSSPPSSSSDYLEHEVSRMDTLAGIAIKYGVEISDIKRANGFVSDSQMFAHKTLRIPLPGKPIPSSVRLNGSGQRTKSFQSMAGETLLTSSGMRGTDNSWDCDDPENGGFLAANGAIAAKNNGANKPKQDGSMRRRQNVEADHLSNTGDTQDDFLADPIKVIKSLLPRPISSMRLNMDASNPEKSSISFLNGFRSVRKSPSAPNFADAEDGTSMRSSSTWTFNHESFTRPLLDGLPKPQQVGATRNKVHVNNNGGGLVELLERQQQQAADRVESLPGQPSDVGFRQFAGYVTVNETHGRALFYWLFEATDDVQDKPLVLWLNGGPGCSSVGYGAMEELGPFQVQNNGEIVLNPNSWNKDANLLFLESPVGVGFSYTNTTDDLTEFGDELAAHDAHVFLVNWFKRFPQFKGHNFYITGESYAGHFVPQLAEKILEGNENGPRKDLINLKGIMIGNAAIDSSSDNRGMAEYAWNHAVISDQVYAAITKECSFSDDEEEESDECGVAWKNFYEVFKDIDIYSLYTPACTSSDGRVPHHKKMMMMMKKKKKKKNDHHHLIPYNTLNPCADNYVIDYMNRDDVQAALHANVIPIPSNKWVPCNDDLSDQVGGFTVVYDGLTFVTIRGAGHMVPMITPVQASQLFAHFLQGMELPANPV
ncbi:hypothetical protein PR202_gb28540 [Eleusine coracana subsp. coracana]|uniref:Carboxypeptidase n=1 Tax=Eleusine coracana subsp. coracana TaxID=191504 RepID=A0AAV5FWM1_ELECO|nr:hypothetical protein PR202_gb28540 [Eleusine coracana subsp. coracana]